MYYFLEFEDYLPLIFSFEGVSLLNQVHLSGLWIFMFFIISDRSESWQPRCQPSLSQQFILQDLVEIIKELVYSLYVMESFRLSIFQIIVFRCPRFRASFFLTCSFCFGKVAAFILDNFGKTMVEMGEVS